MALTLDLPTPCYLFSETALQKNLSRAQQIQQDTNCKILLALKSFAVWKLFGYFSAVLPGVTASSLNEARLGAEEFGGEVHAYAPAWRPDDFATVAALSSHLVFNSRAQWERHRQQTAAASVGVRVNPQYSEISNPLYNPCLPHSQFGVTAADADFLCHADIDGLHFHALCEQNSDSLESVAERIHAQFGAVLSTKRWVNLGGGHLLCNDDYDHTRLAAIIHRFQKKYGITVYLEPGGGLTAHCCRLITSVLDILPNGTVILDASASAHAPEVLETPYRPEIDHSGKRGEKKHSYHLCGATCMAGDVFGDYSFDQPLRVGDKLGLQNMAAYTVVKHTVFNGVAPPFIAWQKEDGMVDILRTPDYEDFRRRMS